MFSLSLEPEEPEADEESEEASAPLRRHLITEAFLLLHLLHSSLLLTIPSLSFYMYIHCTCIFGKKKKRTKKTKL